MIWEDRQVFSSVDAFTTNPYKVTTKSKSLFKLETDHTSKTVQQTGENPLQFELKEADVFNLEHYG